MIPIKLTFALHAKCTSLMTVIFPHSRCVVNELTRFLLFISILFLVAIIIITSRLYSYAKASTCH